MAEMGTQKARILRFGEGSLLQEGASLLLSCVKAMRGVPLCDHGYRIRRARERQIRNAPKLPPA